MHSMTKYINGHTDVVGGMLVFNDEDADPYVLSELSDLANNMYENQGALMTA